LPRSPNIPSPAVHADGHQASPYHVRVFCVVRGLPHPRPPAIRLEVYPDGVTAFSPRLVRAGLARSYLGKPPQQCNNPEGVAATGDRRIDATPLGLGTRSTSARNSGACGSPSRALIFNPNSELGSTPAPGVAGHAPAASISRVELKRTLEIFLCVRFSAGARKTTPGAGVLPFPMRRPRFGRGRLGPRC